MQTIDTAISKVRYSLALYFSVQENYRMHKDDDVVSMVRSQHEDILFEVCCYVRISILHRLYSNLSVLYSCCSVAPSSVSIRMTRARIWFRSTYYGKLFFIRKN